VIRKFLRNKPNMLNYSTPLASILNRQKVKQNIHVYCEW